MVKRMRGSRNLQFAEIAASVAYRIADDALKKLLMLAFFAAALYYGWPHYSEYIPVFGKPAKRHAPGVLVSEDPYQNLVRNGQSWDKNGYRITPLASFEMRGLVLSKHRYSFDREAQLAPIDLALGWGPMSDQAILDHIEISQSNRWYYFNYGPDCPLNSREIAFHSGNMHMIPATEHIEEMLKSVGTGDLVYFSGSLVQIDGTDGWSWRSSLSRQDDGDGSCEVVWVDQLTIL